MVLNVEYNDAATHLPLGNLVCKKIMSRNRSCFCCLFI